MLTIDRGHLAATHRAAVELDASLRAWDHRPTRAGADPNSLAELARLLRDQADYWGRAQGGRLRAVKRVVAKLTSPFFHAQIRYNLLLAEHLVRVEAALEELRLRVEAEPPREGASRR